jgi:TP901 family phage tail tape measure protein
MAGDINQVLGIDASSALEALRALDQGLISFNKNLKGISDGMSLFNSRSNKTIGALKEVKRSAESAAKALQAVNKAQGSSRGAAGFGAGVGAASAPRASNRLLTGQAAADSLASLLGQQTTQQTQAANQLIAAIRPIGPAAQQSFNQASNAAKNLTVSFETMARIVATQLIVRAMSQFRDAVADATREFVQFQQAVARIQTIDSTGASLETVAAAVRGLSDSFNIPLLDTAAGVYQAISNQVGDFEESITFAATAAKLAKTTNSSLADSIDLISGALQAYSLSTAEAEQVSSLFFNAIDKGRITAAELGPSFGRVSSQAAQMGISLEETLGALSQLTIRGVKTSEAMTQFRGIVTALTKPTESMRAALEEMGFATAEQAIGTLRLDGFLRQLAGNTDGTSEALGRLFPEVRGLSGAMVLTGDDVRGFADALRDARDINQDFIDKKFAKVLATDAEQLTSALNKLKNTLTNEVGPAILGFGAGALKAAGGIDNVISVLKVIGPGAVAATTATVGLGLAFVALRGAMVRLAASPALTVFTAVTQAAAITPALVKKLTDETVRIRLRATTELEAQNKVELAATVKANADQLRDYRHLNEDRVALAGEAIQKITKTYFDAVQAARVSNEAIVESTEQSLRTVQDARTSLVNAVKGAIADSEREIKSSARRLQDLSRQEDDLDFEQQLEGRADVEKIFLNIKRGTDLASEATRAYVDAVRSGDKAAQDLAKADLERGKAALQTAKSLAEQSGDRSQTARVRNAERSVINQQQSAEEEVSNILRGRDDLLKNELKTQEAISAEIQKQVKLIQENTSIFDERGNEFTPAEQARRNQTRQQAESRLTELTSQAGERQRLESLGLGEVAADLQADLNAARFVIKIEADVANLERSIKSTLDDIDDDLPFLAGIEEALGRTVRGSARELTEGLTDAVGEAQRLQQAILGAQVDKQQVEQTRAVVNQLLEDTARLPEQAARIGDQAAANAFTTLRERAAALAQQTQVSKEEVALLGAELAKISRGTGGSTAIAADFQTATKLLETLNLLAQQQASAKIVPEADVERFLTLDAALKKIGLGTDFDPLKTKINESATDSTTLANNTVAMKDAAGQAASFWERIASAIHTIDQATPGLTRALGGTPAGNMFGGAQFFAGGGFARGIDTIPAMLSKGEFVINSRSSQRFFSQLQAINAGVRPTFRQDGGNVTTNIGDIHVTVTGSQSATQTGRNIARELRREVRRGSSRL